VEDPFVEGEGVEGQVDGKEEEEGWLKSDRDYTYEEVTLYLSTFCAVVDCLAASSCIPNSS
jgi:hypothetical protein